MVLTYLKWTRSTKLNFHQTIPNKDIIDVLWIGNDIYLYPVLHDVVAEQPVVVGVEVFLVDEGQKATFFVFVKVVFEC